MTLDVVAIDRRLMQLMAEIITKSALLKILSPEWARFLMVLRVVSLRRLNSLVKAVTAVLLGLCTLY